MAGARRIPEPGTNTSRLYVWLVVLSPVLLLVVAALLTVLGLSLDSEGVATIGALGVVASLVLPRMRGPFEFGPAGFKGGLMDDLFDRIIEQGTAQGLPPDEARQVATEVVHEVSDQPTWRYDYFADTNLVSQYLRATHARLADASVAYAVTLRTAVEEIVTRIAAEREWLVRREVEVQREDEAGPYWRRRLDFVLDTAAGPILVETSSARGYDVAFPLAIDLAEVANTLDAAAVFVVVGDDAPLEPSETEGVHVVKLSGLEALLRSLSIG